MRIAVMGRSIRPGLSGVGRYTRNLVESLCAELEPEELTVFLTREHAPLSRSDFTAAPAPFATPNEYLRALWEQTIVPGEVRRRGIALYHSPNYILPLALGCPSIVTIHDLVFRSLPDYHRVQSRLYLSFFTAWAVRRARRLIAVSETTARELARFYPAAQQKTTVIYQGLDPRFTQPPTPEAVREFRRRSGLERPYILCVGTLEPRKNLVRLLEAYRLLVEQHGIPHDLVICGALGWHTGPIRQALGEAAVRDRVRLAGYVSDSELPLWYAAADVFVYPSLFEGFGLPPLEAMACGTPVVLSNAPSLLEVAGGIDPQRDQAAALSVDPFDPQAIAGGLAQVLWNAELAERLRTRGMARAQTFDWAIAARRMVLVYREILEQA